MPRNTVSWRSRTEDSRIASVRRRRRLSKACSCWIVSRTSGSGRFDTLRPSSKIRSTSLRVSVFPSIAFVPHVLSAPVRRHPPGGGRGEPPRHGAGPGKIERLRARFLQHRVGRGRLDPYNEIVAVDADAHVAAQEEGDSAEQLLLGDVFAAPERLADSRGFGLRIRHAWREGNRWGVQKTC